MTGTHHLAKRLICLPARIGMAIARLRWVPVDDCLIAGLSKPGCEGGAGSAGVYGSARRHANTAKRR